MSALPLRAFLCKAAYLPSDTVETRGRKTGHPLDETKLYIETLVMATRLSTFTEDVAHWIAPIAPIYKSTEPSQKKSVLPLLLGMVTKKIIKHILFPTGTELFMRYRKKVCSPMRVSRRVWMATRQATHADTVMIIKVELYERRWRGGT